MIRVPKLWPAMFAVALVLGWAGPLCADEAVRGRIKSVTAENNQFVLTEDSGKDRLYTLVENGSAQAGGVLGKVSGLKPGQVVIVTYVTINKGLYATNVLPAPKAEGRTMEGTVKEVRGGRIIQNEFVLTDRDKKDWLFTLTDNARVVTADDQNASLRSLKAGARVEVTYVRLPAGGVYASEVRQAERSRETGEPKPGRTREPRP